MIVQQNRKSPSTVLTAHNSTGNGTFMCNKRFGFMTRREKTHIRLGIRSVSPSDQSPRCPHEKTLRLYQSTAKFHGVSLRNVAEILREMSRKFSANLRGVSPRHFPVKTLGEISVFYFSPRKKHISRKGCSAAKREKRAFFLG